MEYIHWFQQNFLHLDKSLEHIVSVYGLWVYAILFAIIFCETGLVITPFLPGDALLFAVGAYAAAHPGAGLSYPLILGLLIIAAILGNLVNFTLGSLIGGKIFKPGALILKKEYLDRTHLFFEKHGIMGVIIARFLPIFRTVAPFCGRDGRHGSEEVHALHRDRQFPLGFPDDDLRTCFRWNALGAETLRNGGDRHHLRVDDPRRFRRTLPTIWRPGRNRVTAAIQAQ